MKYKMLLLCLMGSVGIYSQVTGFGIQPKVNFSSQLFINPLVEFRHGVSGTANLASAGIDVFTDYQIGNRLKVRGKIGVETKGFANEIVVFNENMMEFSVYNYASLDLGVTYDVVQWDKSALYVAGGLSNGYVFRKVRSAESYSFMSEPSYSSNNFIDYDSYNLGGVIALGYNVGDVLWLEAEWNRDILAPVNSHFLKVYNSVYSVNVGINLLKLFRKERAA